MLKRGVKFGICNEIFGRWKIEEAMQLAATTGYDVIEIAPFTIAQYVTEISPQRRVEIRRAAEAANIGISGIHWVLAQTEGLYINHPDAAVRERTAKYLVELVDFGADLGGGIMVVGSPKQRNIMEGVTPEQAWSWATDCFRDAVKVAEKRNLTICFEPLAPSETNFINTAEEGIRFAEQFSSEAMKIILDVKAMSSEPRPIPEIIQRSAGKFAYFHANDKNLKGPGFGEVDFVPIAKALRGVNYEGVVSVEVFNFEEGPEVIARRSLEYLKASFSTAR